jgi:hypothetical protein
LELAFWNAYVFYFKTEGKRAPLHDTLNVIQTVVEKYQPQITSSKERRPGCFTCAADIFFSTYLK